MNRGNQPTPVTRLLAISAWMGLGYGLFEGTESFILSRIPNALSWENGNSVEAMMVMPGLYLVAYLALCLLFIPLTLVVRRPWWDVVLVFLLASFSGYLAAKTTGAMAQWASMILGLGIGTVAVRLYRRHRERWSLAVLRRLPAMVAAALIVIGGSFLAARFVESRELAALSQPAANRPNVLLIVLDTQRADFLSSYGNQRFTTPHLDSLAAGGVLFERAFATSSWTLPTHISLFTGLLGFQHRTEERPRRVLQPGPVTLAELLSREGYATAGFVANLYWTGRQTGLARGFAHYEDYYGTMGDALHRATLVREFGTIQQMLGAIDVQGRKRAGHVNREVLGWLGRVKGRPFFAFLNYFDVHAPYLPPAPFRGRFGVIRPEFTAKRLEIGNQPKRPQTPERWAYRVDRYQEAMLYLDDHLGKLFAELKRRGVLDNTIVIVTSDHGEHFGEHGIGEHGASLYSQETWVPLIIRFPSRIPAGMRVSIPVSVSDVPATITALAGMRDTFPGRSLLLPAGAPGPVAVPVVSEMAKTVNDDPKEWPGSKGWVKSLVVDQWHYILLENGEEELFNLATDVHEETNLAAVPEHAAVLKDLRGRLQGIVGLKPAP
jgi:arylsulfatase A-like enzyme